MRVAGAAEVWQLFDAQLKKEDHRAGALMAGLND